jgi:hypothetical protein
MTPDCEVLKPFFTAKAVGYPTVSAPYEIATLLALGELTAEHRASIVSKYGLEGDPRLQAIFLDWVIELVQVLLTQGAFSSEYALALRPVKASLGIREGDFLSMRPMEIKAVLCEQLTGLLEDGVLEEHEELAQSDLQSAFDLGYDQYLGLTRPLYEVAIGDLILRLKQALPEDAARLQRRLLNLQSVCTLAMAQPRSLGGLK